MSTVTVKPKAQRMNWPEFYGWLRRNVHPGEHAFVVGSTGEGKSVLLGKVVPLFGRNIVVLDGKGGDDPSLKWPGFEHTDRWPPPQEQAGLFTYGVLGKERPPIRVIVTRKVKDRSDFPKMRELFETVLDDLLRRKGKKVYAVVIDEAQIVSDPIEGMGLKRHIGPLIRTKRYDGMSVIQATQWPTWIGPSSSREAMHRWAFRVDALDEMRELAKKFGEDPATFVPVMKSLRPYEFVYKHKRSRLVVVSKVKR